MAVLEDRSVTPTLTLNKGIDSPTLRRRIPIEPTEPHHKSIHDHVPVLMGLYESLNTIVEPLRLSYVSCNAVAAMYRFDWKGQGL